MKTKALLLALAVGILCSPLSRAQPSFPDCTNCVQLNAWYFPDTNWLSDAGYSPVNFSNIVNIGNARDGDGMLLDTTNTTPAFLFYNIVETNSDSTTFTNITPQSGTLYVWLNPTWSSSNQSGTGPGDWANIISMGDYGTNGSSWWAWYISPTGDHVFFASQTNGGSPVVYLSAPVSFLATNWYNLTLTYSATNCAFYTNGVLVTNGTGVEYWPGSDVTFFAIGSDTNGYHQIRSELSDFESFNYQFDSNLVWGSFTIITPCYGLAGTNGYYSPSPNIVQAPPSDSGPFYDAVTGPGFLVANGTSATYPTSSNVWITNYTATVISSNVVNINFAIAGGSNNAPYDVFATTALLAPATNTVWYWMGQGYRGTNYVLPVTNIPPANAFIILGTMQDSDHDGLTDAYELLVSHTNPNNADTDGDGISDGWEVALGLNPLVNDNAQTNSRSNFSYDSTDWLTGISGVKTGAVALDPEGNVLSVSQ